jgi:hypothetical protein
MAFTKLREWVGCFKAVLNEVLKITVDLSGSIVDHDLAHLSQALSNPRDNGSLGGTTIRRSPSHESIKRVDLVGIPSASPVTADT